MAADPDLIERLRAALAGERDLSEQRMFGGHAFLLGGHMAISASRSGGLLVRVDPGEAAQYLAIPGVEPMQMGGRPTAGWLHVDSAAAGSDAELTRWVETSMSRVRSLPPKA